MAGGRRIDNMSNDQTIDTLPPEERARLRKQLGEQAVRLAVSSRWDEAVTVNREFVRLFGDEPDALNRLGKALSEVGQISEARKAYGRSIELDPTNTIARRNLDRLAGMQDSVVAGQAQSQLDTRLFVEESGKATVAKLQAVDGNRTAVLDPGDLVELQVQGNAVNVVTNNGGYIGMIEPRIGLRMAKMMAAGNLYSAALVTATGDVKVMLRETFQHPSQIGRVSFPQSRATDFRAYTRKGLLRGEDPDYGDDGDDDGDDEVDDWTEASDDLASPVDVDIESDDDGFD
ncbi:MAG: tetratricopeptide repeat protein [Dehalococcoidia bacterium]